MRVSVLVRWFILLALGVLLPTACSSGGGAGDGGPSPATTDRRWAR